MPGGIRQVELYGRSNAFSADQIKKPLNLMFRNKKNTVSDATGLGEVLKSHSVCIFEKPWQIIVHFFVTKVQAGFHARKLNGVPIIRFGATTIYFNHSVFRVLKTEIFGFIKGFITVIWQVKAQITAWFGRVALIAGNQQKKSHDNEHKKK